MKIGVPPGGERLASTPFDAFDSNLSILLSGQLTGAAVPENADQIKIWDSSAQGFKSAFLADNTGNQNKDGKWFKDNVNWEPSDIILSPGTGFFIKNNQLTDQSVFLSGRIPLDDSRILTLQPNLNLFSYPFASIIPLNSADLKNGGAKGGLNQNDSPDLVITDSPRTEHWLMDNPAGPSDGKWLDGSAGISALELKPGSGYWYERRGLPSFQWSENRPYRNPFNVNASAPSIVDMVFNPAHDEITLDIDCTGMPGETLEIFFKDLAADDPLTTESGWALADGNISTSGNTHIFWTDAGRTNAVHPFVNRGRINSTFMRIFIVSRQDIDSDNDGISNGREQFVYGTKPDNPDSDGDGISDGDEVNIYDTNPNAADSDGDGYNDFKEINLYHTDPNNSASSPANMPSGWIDADIGPPGALGSARYFDGTFTVKGAGTDIYGTSDKFNYLYQDLYGDCTVIARVVSQQNTNALAKAGIMIRENLNANSRNVFAFITPGTGGTENCYYQERTAVAGTSARSGAYLSATAYPYWLKLVKTGNVYNSYKSADGTSWTAIYTNRTVAAGNAVKIGLAVTSTINTSVSTAVFDSFSITRTLSEIPAISPNGGYFQMSRQVTLSASVPDSRIRYTIDGSEPAGASQFYTVPFSIDSNRTVKAKLFKAGYNPGPTATAMFKQPGLMVKYYQGSWTTLPDFSTLIPYKVSMIPNIDFPDNYGHIMTSERNDNVGAVITGQMHCPTAGPHTFYLSSGEGAALYLDGVRIINVPGLRAFAQTASAAKNLTAGFHDIRIEYFEAAGSGGLQLKWTYPGQTSAVIMAPKDFYSPDSDADGLPDQWEMYKFGNLSHDGNADTDSDGICDKEELNLYFTDPSDPSMPFAASTPENTSPGIAVTYCAKNNRTWTYVPDFNHLPQFGATSVANINYASTTTVPFADSGLTDNVAAFFRGYVNIAVAGMYKFYLKCDDGANLYLDGRKIIDNDGQHSSREAYGYAPLKAGMHEVRVDYYETGAASELVLSYEGPGIAKQVVPASVLFHSTQYLVDMIAGNDADSDGLTDTYETAHGTNPKDWDSVNATNTISDGDRVAAGTANGPLPSAWTDADIGSPGVAGSANYDPSTFTVRGAGADIYGTADMLNCCYQDLYGDCEVIVRVAVQSNTNAWAKAGIMIRENLNSSSRNAFAFLTPGNGTNFQYRGSAGASTSRVAGAGATTPYWLKLVKSGNSYTSYKSKDGSIWVPINTAPVSVPMGNSVKVGLAVTSMNNSIRSVADFDNFSIRRTLTETPAISPNGGYFQMSRQVTLNVTVPDAQIRYSLDDSEPTGASTLYTTPLNITASCTVKARTFKEGYNPSPSSAAVFNQPGLMVKYYAGNWTSLPDFSKLAPYKGSMLPNLDYPDNYGHIMTSGLCDNVGAVITGQINCPVPGAYTFYLSSGEGAKLFIDNNPTPIINVPGLRAFAQTASAAKTLTAGFHDIRIEYFEAAGSGGLQLKWTYPGQTSAVIMAPKDFYSPDSDADSLPDQWEMYKFGNLSHDGNADTDSDGICDKEELTLYFTDPADPSVPLTASTPANTSPGIAVTYCAKNNRIWTAVPDFDRLPHYGATSVNQINYPASTAKFATSGTAANVAAQFNGFIDIPADGFYKFYLNCDDGANLYIDNKKIVDNDGLHTMRETYGFASLKAGKHNIWIDYYQTISTNGLILSYEGPGLPKQIVPASALFHSPQYLQDMIATDDPDSDGINTITASAGANGSISPTGTARLEYGANQSYAITPNTNYRVSDVLVDGASAGAVASYQFTNVKRPHTISANFAINTHNVTFNIADKGTRSGGGELSQAVNHGGGATAPTVTANAGWTFTGWDKTLNNITSDTTVTAQYAMLTYTISASAGSNGSITPKGMVTLGHGTNQSFMITPDANCHVTNALVDGISVGSVTGYQFTNVTANHNISASFALDIYTLTYNAGANGSIFGITPQTVHSGGDVTYSFEDLHFSGLEQLLGMHGGIDFGANGDWSSDPNVFGLAKCAFFSGDISSASFTLPADGYLKSLRIIGGASCSYTVSDGVNTPIAGAMTANTPQTVTTGWTTGGTIITIATDGNQVVATDEITYWSATVLPAEVSAIPDVGYQFVSWSDGIASASRTETNVSADMTVTANFAINTYTVSFDFGYNGLLQGEKHQIVDYNGSCSSVIAVPNTGYRFVKWIIAPPGAASASDFNSPAIAVENVKGDCSITATFCLENQDILISGGNLYTKSQTILIDPLVFAGTGYEGILVSESPTMNNPVLFQNTGAPFTWQLPSSRERTYMLYCQYADASGVPQGEVMLRQIILDTTNPSLEIISPVNGGITDQSFVRLELMAFDPNPLEPSQMNSGRKVKVLVNGEIKTNLFNNRLVIDRFPVSGIGVNNITVSVQDEAGNVTERTVTWTVLPPSGTVPPTLSGINITGDSGSETGTGVTTVPDVSEIWVQGMLDNPMSNVRYSVNAGGFGEFNIVRNNAGNYQFCGLVPLKTGANAISIEAYDVSGNLNTYSYALNRSTHNIKITSHSPESFANGAPQNISGTISSTICGEAVTSVTVNGVSVASGDLIDNGDGTLTFTANDVIPEPDGSITSVDVGAETETGRKLVASATHIDGYEILRRYVVRHWSSQWHVFASTAGWRLSRTMLFGDIDLYEPAYNNSNIQKIRFFAPNTGMWGTFPDNTDITSYPPLGSFWGETGMLEYNIPNGSSSSIASALVANKDSSHLFESGMWKDYSSFSGGPTGNPAPDIDVLYEKCSTFMEVKKPLNNGKLGEKVKVLLSFSGMTYERFTNSPALDLSLVKYKGEKTFSVDLPTSTATYLVELQRGVSFTISDSDFDWPKFTKTTVSTYVNTPVNPDDPPTFSITSTTTDRGRFSFDFVHNAEVKLDLVPDYNHDRIIDDFDKKLLRENEPYRFWVNDDSDDGDVGRGDISGSGWWNETFVANHTDGKVNGRRDLVDFFPVHLDIRDALNIFAPADYKYVLCSSQSGSLNVLFSYTLKASCSGSYQINEENGNIAGATVEVISGSGLEIDETMLNNIKSSSDNGIILLEAKKESENNTLILKILDRKNGEKEMIRQELPLIISKVEKMFTSVNLRSGISGGAATVTHAENVPTRDELRVKKHFVFVHGYNVNANQARGWNSEVFKRIYWSGSLADFHGASWNGSETQYVPLVASLTVDYHANVLNAFKSAASLSYYLNSLNNNAAPVTIAAHSLGNMLVSSAIADHGAKVTNYLMIDAAVASEAYDGAEPQIQDMWRSEWGDFYNAWNGAADKDKPKYYRLLAAGWYSLFDNSDARSRLTWKDRFENNPNNVNFYNFYSSGEEVLDTHAYGGNASIWAYLGTTIVQSDPPTGRYAWAFQEKLKGIMETNFILGSYYGGWGFNLYGYHNGIFPAWWNYTSEQAFALSDDELKAKPFFNASGPHTALYDNDQAAASAHAGNYLNRAEILARMIPALTQAAGKVENQNQSNLLKGQFNMQTSFQTGWPRERLANDKLLNNWFHSDLIDIAYIYTSRLYNSFVEIGKLNEK